MSYLKNGPPDNVKVWGRKLTNCQEKAALKYHNYELFQLETISFDNDLFLKGKKF
jgi:hypothetical protein